MSFLKRFLIRMKTDTKTDTATKKPTPRTENNIQQATINRCEKARCNRDNFENRITRNNRKKQTVKIW